MIFNVSIKMTLTAEEAEFNKLLEEYKLTSDQAKEGMGANMKAILERELKDDRGFTSYTIDVNVEEGVT